MTTQEASYVLAVLLAGYPNFTLEPEAARFWITELEILKNAEAATETAREIARGSDRFPPLAEFRRSYRAVLELYSERPAQLEPAPSSREIPSWVKRWIAARYLYRRFDREQDLRPFPQQQGYVDPLAELMPDDEWVREGEQVRDKDVWQALK